MGLAAKIKRLRGERTQAELAELVGVGKTAVSMWENGDNTPSAETYLKLADLAPFPDSLWFLEQAGMKEATLLATAEHVLRQRSTPISSDQFVRVPFAGGEVAEAQLALRGEYLPSPLSTRCLIVDKQVHGALPLGSLVVLDGSRSSKNSPDLTPFWDQVVLVSFGSREEADLRFDEPWPKGLHIGRLKLQGKRGDLRWAAELAPLTEAFDASPLWVGGWAYAYPPDVKRVYGQPHVARELPEPIKRKMAQRQKELEERGVLVHDQEIADADAEAGLAAQRKERSIQEEAEKEAEAQAPSKVRLRPGCEIVGLVLGWFCPPAGEERSPEKLKPQS